MTEIYDIQVIKHKPIFNDEFFNSYIKDLYTLIIIGYLLFEILIKPVLLMHLI